MRSRCFGALVMSAWTLAACAALPGSGMRAGIGQEAGRSAVLVLLWVPDQLQGPLWLQFAGRPAQGASPGESLSVLAEAPPASVDLPSRPGWRPQLVAAALDPGDHVLVRWMAELDDGRVAISSPIGWTFPALAAQVTELQAIELSIDPVHAARMPYRLRPAPPARIDRASWLPQAAAMAWSSAPFPADARTEGTALVSGTVRKLIPNSTSVYVR